MIVLTFFLFVCAISKDSNKKNDQKKFPVLKGPYLGQKPPGILPEIFAPDIISHGFHELSISFSPDGKEMFYVTSDKSYSHYFQIHLERKDDVWSGPEVSPFMGNYSIGSQCFSPDGRKLYFSKRPIRVDPGPVKNSDIWMVEKTGDTWNEPINLGKPINTEDIEMNPSISANGTIYFAVRKTKSKGDIYFSRFINGTFIEPEKMSIEINSEHNESRPFIAPDENFLLFQSDRPRSFGGNDLYVSFKQEDNRWGKPVNLGETINSSWSDFGPYVSPDGKYLFFSSYRTFNPEDFKGKSYTELMKLYRSPKNGYATLYWVDAKVIEELKPKELK